MFFQKLGKDPVFKKLFQGIYSDQKICQGCPHRYSTHKTINGTGGCGSRATSMVKLFHQKSSIIGGFYVTGAIDNAYSLNYAHM